VSRTLLAQEIDSKTSAPLCLFLFLPDLPRQREIGQISPAEQKVNPMAKIEGVARDFCQRAFFDAQRAIFGRFSNDEVDVLIYLPDSPLLILPAGDRPINLEVMADEVIR
jgi:hypothetical protein